MKILFFLYHFPPLEGSANSRNKRIAEAIARRAEKGIVLTPSGKTDHPVTLPGLDIYYTPAYDYRWLTGYGKNGRTPSEKSKSKGISQLAIRLINTYPFSILIGEGGLLYFIFLLIRGHRLIRKEKITHLYSSFRPFADHYAAYWLKKRHPDVYWIADFRDLPIDPHYGHIFFPKWHETFFHQLFQKANLVTTVSAGLAQSLRAYSSHVLVLRNGIPPEAIKPQPRQSPFFTIVYTGSMFLDKRNAEPLFQALFQLIQERKINPELLRIIYAGKDGMIWRKLAARYEMSANFSDKGLLPQQEAKQWQRDACINILLTVSSNRLQGVLTGKMIEYIEAGSPVLAIVTGQNDPELTAILAEVNLGLSCTDLPSDLEQIRNFIMTEYQAWQKSNLCRKPVKWEVVQEKYQMAKILESVFHEV